jgi:hypothetical protein
MNLEASVIWPAYAFNIKHLQMFDGVADDGTCGITEEQLSN